MKIEPQRGAGWIQRLKLEIVAQCVLTEIEQMSSFQIKARYKICFVG